MGVDRYDGNEIKHYQLDETVESKDHILYSTTMTLSLIHIYEVVMEGFHLSALIENDMIFLQGRKYLLLVDTDTVLHCRHRHQP